MYDYWAFVFVVMAVMIIAIYVDRYTKYNCRVVSDLLVLFVVCLCGLGGCLEVLK